MSEYKLCNECGLKDGTVRIRRIDGSEVEELLLCDDCAKSHGIDHGYRWRRPSTGDLLEHLIEPNESDADERIQCPVCGTDRRSLKKNGRVGCAECYRALQPEVGKLIGEVREGRGPLGPGAGYRGRMPRKLRRYKALFVDRELIRERLQSALEAESYEDAASLRDQLSELDQRIFSTDESLD